MNRISATSISSFWVKLHRFAALTFIALLFGCLLLPNPATGDSTEARVAESQVGLTESLGEPPTYAPWVHLAELTPETYSVGFDILAISPDGNTIITGDPYHDFSTGNHIEDGLVRVYTKPEEGEWEDAQGTAILTASDGYDRDRFGISVAISDDLIVIGKEYGQNIYVFAKPTAGWQDMTETARLGFKAPGYAVSVGESIAIMGDSILSGDTGYQNDSFPNRVYGAVFVWNKPPGGWVDTDSIDAMLTAEDIVGEWGYSFGGAIATSGNTLVTSGSKGAYIFERPSGGWTNMTQTAKLSSETYGGSVAIDDDTVVVGAPGAFYEGVGAAYVFEKTGQAWVDMTETAKLTATDGTLPNGNSIQFGHSVVISGKRVAVGAAGNSDAFVFHKPANGWVNMTETTHFPSDAGGHYHRPSVAIRDDVLVVGIGNDKLDVYRDQYNRPIMVIPGIYGSYFKYDLLHRLWNRHRGINPDWLVIDPLAHAYDDLVQTLKNVGYVDGKDLFVVAYDWRLMPGPVDGAYDGRIGGLSGQSITDKNYQYGVDYLGYYLRKAAETWEENNPDEPLESVDIISHSTGGLVARSYIQSAAYGDDFVSSGNKTLSLPTVKNLIMVAVPNRGASQPWQAMENNFIIDGASKYVMSKILNVAYQKVLAGGTITGFPEDITLASISSNGTPLPKEFINQYVPTFRSLLATYDFMYDIDGDLGNVNDMELVRNDLVLDLNNGLDVPNQSPPSDPSPFANLVDNTLVIYADSIDTEYRVRRREDSEWNAVFRLDDYFESDVPAGVPWYLGVSEAVGDGTVPRESSVGQFIGDNRIKRYRATKDNVSHTGLMSNFWVQAEILDLLEPEWEEEDVSESLARKSHGSIVWNAFVDPVDMVLVDGSGKRFGYTAVTGPITEIPNSVWFGGDEGIGWIFGRVTPPLRVELTGLGESYLVQLSGTQMDLRGGYESSGFLGVGETISAPMDIEILDMLFMPVLLKSRENPWPTAIPTTISTQTPTPTSTAVLATTSTPPTHTPTPTITPSPTITPTPSATQTPANSITLTHATTLDSDNAKHMAFAKGDEIKLCLTIENSSQSPIQVFGNWDVRDQNGGQVEALSWNGNFSVPPETPVWCIVKALDGIASGQYTLTGSITYNNQTQTLNTVFYVSESLLMSDDFSNLGSGWPELDSASVAYGYDNHQLFIRLKNANWYAMVTPGLHATAAVMEVVAWTPSDFDGGYGIIFSISGDGQSFYRLRTDNTGWYHISKRDSGNWMDIHDWTQSDALNTGNDPNQLMVVRQGTKLAVYANGSHLTTLTDDPAADGRVGLTASSFSTPNFEGRFDDFRIFTLSTGQTQTHNESSTASMGEGQSE